MSFITPFRQLCNLQNKREFHSISKSLCLQFYKEWSLSLEHFFDPRVQIAPTGHLRSSGCSASDLTFLTLVWRFGDDDAHCASSLARSIGSSRAYSESWKDRWTFWCLRNVLTTDLFVNHCFINYSSTQVWEMSGCPKTSTGGRAPLESPAYR